MGNRECRNAREFGELFRSTVRDGGFGWRWKKDMRPWLAEALGGAKFGDARYGWTVEDARGLGREFLNEASTW